MRKMTVIAVLLGLIPVPTYAVAQNDSVEKIYPALRQHMINESAICLSPRVSTSEQCRADYEVTYMKIAAYLGSHDLYMRAFRTNDASAIEKLWKQVNRSKEELAAAEDNLLKYFPPRASAIPQPIPVSR